MKLKITFLLIVINSMLIAQPEITWIKEYGSLTQNEIGISVTETNNRDGYVLCGYKHIQIDIQDLILIRTDVIGDTLWTKQYGVPNSINDGMKILKTGDGYIVGGMLFKPSISHWTAWLLKIDENGDSLWSKTILDSARIMAVCSTPDGGYAAAGTRYSGTHTRLFISRVDQAGNVIWLNFYGNYSDSYGVDITCTYDSGFAVLGGEYDSSFTTEKLWLLKTDNSGIIISDQLYDIRCTRGTIQQTFDESFILAAESYNNGISFLKINPGGEILDSLNYTGNFHYPEISQTADSGLIYMYTEPWDTTNSVVIRFRKLDQSFNNVWAKDISGSHDYYGMSFILTSDNGLAVTGYSVDSQNSIYSDILLAKLDGDITPVELIAFKGSVQGNYVILNWKTAAENNNYGFDIELSADKTNWQEIGFAEGNGTSTVPHTYSFIDSSRQSGVVYYRLKQIDLDGSFTYSNEIKVELSPAEFSLDQNYPNPFNPVTTINYSIPVQENVKLEVYNILGQKVTTLINEVKPSGKYKVKFSAGDLASGIYIYQLTAGRSTLTKKMLLLR